jgi:hypothetical protein
MMNSLDKSSCDVLKRTRKHMFHAIRRTEISEAFPTKSAVAGPHSAQISP